jgi:hypothetical protein
MRVFSLALLLCAISSAQDTTAAIEGRMLEAGPPRLVQFGLNLVF